MPHPSLLNVLARAFLAGQPVLDQIVARGERALGREWPWLLPLAHRYRAFLAGKTRPRHRDVVRFFREDDGLQQALSRHSRALFIGQWLSDPQEMQADPAAAGWDVPVIESVGALAEWFWVDAAHLDWYADLKGLTAARLGHYHYTVLPKPSGNIRLIEAPKRQTRKLQRQILEWILNRIPPHPAAHGFVKGRSIQTFAAPHAAQAVVLRMDLRDFFPSVRAARIQTMFRTLGYPEPVADLLGGICTNAVPSGFWKDAGLGIEALREARLLYSRPHLPQGAPTSPALANLCTYRVDCRLAGLASASGAAYTRYADDLAFSGGGEFARGVDRFSTHVAAIVLEEGFQVQHRKTRVMRQGVRQHLAGLVTNHHLNVKRADFDLLKAILTNCVRLGPESQNRDAHPAFRAHLEGRVGFVECVNPEKGRRLRAILNQIEWQPTSHREK